MKKENSFKNFDAGSFDFRACMDIDYIDDDGTISIWKMLARPMCPASDPRHLSPEMRDRLVRHRIAQMEQEATRNIALLQSLGRD